MGIGLCGSIPIGRAHYRQWGSARVRCASGAEEHVQEHLHQAWGELLNHLPCVL